MMIVNELANLRTLHEKKRSHGLSPHEAVQYREAVDRLLTVALAVQEGERPGQARRRAVRVRRAVAVDLCSSKTRVRGLTRDVGAGGFSVLLAAHLPAGEPMVASLHIGRGAPIRAGVRVVRALGVARGSARLSVAFIDLPRAEANRLEDYFVEQLLPARAWPGRSAAG